MICTASDTMNATTEGDTQRVKKKPSPFVRRRKGYMGGEVSDKYGRTEAFPVDSAPARVTALGFRVLDGR